MKVILQLMGILACAWLALANHQGATAGTFFGMQTVRTSYGRHYFEHK